VKRDLEKLIHKTAEAARVWAAAARPAAQLPDEELRPAFSEHRLICTIAEMETLLAVHQTLWPQDQSWRERYGDSMIRSMNSRPDVTRLDVAKIAEEERPNFSLARSQNVEDLFEFFCQIRKSILFDDASTDAFLSASDTKIAIAAAMESVRALDRSRRAALKQAVSGLISNSFMYSPARLQNGAVLGERYWPLFQAVRLLRGETQVNIEEIRSILHNTKISNTTRDRVLTLIDELSRILADSDIDTIRDVLGSGGQLFPWMGDDGGIVLVPGNGPDHCAPIVLAVAKGKDGRSQNGLPNVMRELRAHLIRCFQCAEVVILLTDRWDPDLMKDSEGDFSAYASRPSGAGHKVIIPIVSWKRQLTAYEWP